MDDAGERVAAELAYDTDGLVRKKKEGGHRYMYQVGKGERLQHY